MNGWKNTEKTHGGVFMRDEGREMYDNLNQDCYDDYVP